MFFRLHAFLDPATARLKVDSFLLALPREVQDAQVCVVSPSSAELGSFLRVLTSCLQRLALASLESMLRETVMKLGASCSG